VNKAMGSILTLPGVHVQVEPIDADACGW